MLLPKSIKTSMQLQICYVGSWLRKIFCKEQTLTILNDFKSYLSANRNQLAALPWQGLPFVSVKCDYFKLHYVYVIDMLYHQYSQPYSFILSHWVSYSRRRWWWYTGNSQLKDHLSCDLVKTFKVLWLFSPLIAVQYQHQMSQTYKDFENGITYSFM